MEQVYIFDFGEKVKIGYSTNVNQRLTAIESASGAKAKQIYTVNGTRQIEQAVAFKALCKERGKTSNTVLREYVLNCLDDPNAPK